MATKPQTVLVVEDEASIASFVAAYLKNAGYTVRTTASGTEALKLVESEKPALVVLDLMLPDIDGAEVCKPIRQTGDRRTVDVHVRQLRRKLGDASPIVTVWGVGYKVSPAREPAKA